MRTALFTLTVVLFTTAIASAKIPEFYTLRQKTLAASHIAVGKVILKTDSQMMIRFESAIKGKPPIDLVSWNTGERHFEQSYEDVAKGDTVLAFVICAQLPKDKTLEAKYGSPKRMLVVKATAQAKREVASLMADMKMVTQLAEAHNKAKIKNDGQPAEVPQVDPINRGDYKDALLMIQALRKQAATQDAKLKMKDAERQNFKQEIITLRAQFHETLANIKHLEAAMQQSQKVISVLDQEVRALRQSEAKVIKEHIAISAQLHAMMAEADALRSALRFAKEEAAANKKK